jgi:hypothetical protein
MYDRRLVNQIRSENERLFFPKWMGDIPKQGANWSQAEQEHARKLIKAGCTINEIAINHGRTPLAIFERLKHCSEAFRRFTNTGSEGVDECDVYDISYAWLWDSSVQSPAQRKAARLRDEFVEVKIEGNDLLNALSESKALLSHQINKQKTRIWLTAAATVLLNTSITIAILLSI